MKVEIVNSEGIVEVCYRYAEDEFEYLSSRHSLFGDYTIRTETKCRILQENGVDVVLNAGEEIEVELVPGTFLVFADPSVTVPDWGTIHREYHEAKADAEANHNT